MFDTRVFADGLNIFLAGALFALLLGQFFIFRSRIKKYKNLFGLTVASILYGLSVPLAGAFNDSIFNFTTYLHITTFFGFSTTYFYFLSISDYFKKRIGFKYSPEITLAFLMLIGTSLVSHFFFDSGFLVAGQNVVFKNLYITSVGLSMNMSPLTAVCISVILMVTVYFIYSLLIHLKKEDLLKKEWALVVGAFVSIGVIVNDLSMGTDLTKYTFPIGALGPLFEIARIQNNSFKRHIFKVTSLREDVRLMSNTLRNAQLQLRIAHDIRNHLAVVKGRANIIAIKPERAVELGKKIADTSDQVANILKTHLTMSKPKNTADLMDISLAKMAKDAWTVIHLSMDEAKGMKFTVEGDHKLLGYETDWLIVFTNLMRNSVQALDEKSKAWIKVQFANEKVVFSDSGNGVAEPELLFKKSNSKKVGGFGLGMSIIKDVLNSSQFEISYDEEATNTTFVIQKKVEENQTQAA